MRLVYSFLLLVCFIPSLTCAKPSPLQERLLPIKSTANQNYVLLKPLSATLSYIYYTTQSLSPSSHDDPSINTTKFNTNNDNTIFINEQKENRIIINNNNASSNTIDVNHHNGPVTALALVLFFCVLTF